MAQHYDINLDDKFGSLQLIDLPAEIAAHEPWFNQTLTTVNDSVVRLGIIEGDFHWHKHEVEDEFFLVIEGRLLIDLEDRETVRLDPHQGYTVPRGVLHRTRAPVRTAILMVEPAGGAPPRRAWYGAPLTTSATGRAGAIAGSAPPAPGRAVP